MARTEVQLDQQSLIDKYQPLMDQEEFTKRGFFELCRDVLVVRQSSSVILVGQNVDVELRQSRPIEIHVEFIRDDDTSESWDINSHPIGRQRFETSFYFGSGIQVSFVAGEVSGLGMNVPDVNLELTNAHIFKLAKTVWDAHLNSPQR